MRMRHKPWALPEMQQDDKFFETPRGLKGKWQAEFGNDWPIDLEIGCGRGDFISDLADREPNRNYIAMDLKNEVLVYALRKVNDAELANVRILSMKAEELDEVFAPGEISTVYINFANPWPKASQNKRRLTHTRFLSLYRLFLREDSIIQFKTDDEGLYAASLEYFPEAGYEILYHTDDLPVDYPGNIQTEYESKFRDFGMPIYRIDARMAPVSEERMRELLEYKEKSRQRAGRRAWTNYRKQAGQEQDPDQLS